MTADNVRSTPGGVARVCTFLRERGLELEGATPDGVGHRLSKEADPGPGTVSFDVLAPDGRGRRERPPSSLFYDHLR
ncbi:MAG TPA: hypothetical protein VLR26_15315 [Frankiaceae bacterium]|nr:hypothetical protein [Frankiaceae bacterium]